MKAPKDPTPQALHAVAAVKHEQIPCVLHRSHSPITVTNELHHVFPEYLQHFVWGKTRDKERQSVCATGHNSIHTALSEVLRSGEYPRWCIGKTRDMVEEAMARYEAAQAPKKD